MASDSTDTQLQAFMKQLGARLRSARNNVGMSMQGSADFLSVKKATVGHWETGRNPIGADKLFRLARKYGTTVPALVSSHMTRADLAALVLNLEVAATTAPANVLNTTTDNGTREQDVKDLPKTVSRASRKVSAARRADLAAEAATIAKGKQPSRLGPRSIKKTMDKKEWLNGLVCGI